MLKNDWNNFAIFEEVVHNFGMSDDDMIFLKKCLFPIYAYVVWSKNLERYLIPLTNILAYFRFDDARHLGRRIESMTIVSLFEDENLQSTPFGPS